MGGKLGTGGGAVSDINMTPLIDIVLVVLIIMMVNMPIQIEEMGIKLPGEKTDTTPPPPDSAEQLVVALYKDGKLALNRRLMTEDVLLYEVTRRLRPLTKKNVFIDAAAEVPYGQLVHLVDLAREAGAAKVGLARMKETGPLEATSVHPGSMPRGITVGSPRVVGGITEKQADDAFKAVVPKIRACYNQALALDRSLSGRLLIKTTIGPKGNHMEPPKFARGSELESQALRDCIAPLLPTIVYQPLGDQETAVAQYPVLFSPG